MKVRFAVLPPDRIFNLTSARYLLEISRAWPGKKKWHDARYEPLRDLIEAEYIAGFNRASGHYDKLLRSVEREGFRNPIIVSAGGLQKRREWEIPPSARGPDLIVSEYLGGSRLWAAEQLGIPVPCIVNDFRDVLPDAEVLPDLGAVLAKFTDRPARSEMHGSGPVYINVLPFMHLPEGERYSMSEQVAKRRAIVEAIRIKVRDWMRINDVA